MGVLYQDDEHIIGITWLRKRTYVTDRRQRTTVYPPSALIEKLHSCTVELTLMRLTEGERQLIGSYLMGRFAASALAPGSVAASIFLTATPERILAAALEGARRAMQNRNEIDRDLRRKNL